MRWLHSSALTREAKTIPTVPSGKTLENGAHQVKHRAGFQLATIPEDCDHAFLLPENVTRPNPRSCVFPMPQKELFHAKSSRIDRTNSLQ